MAATAEAAQAEPAYAAYAAGDYAKAVDLASRAGRAEDLALAARAINAVAYFDDGRKSARKSADEAFDIAEKAAVLDARLPEAHLQAAIALALKGARMSPVRAFISGLAGKARERNDVALALDPEIVFLDGPTAGLDPIGAENFDRLIVTLKNSLGLTVFMVTHDLDTLHATCDRVAVLAEKKVIAIGPLGEVRRSDGYFLCGLVF